MSVVVFDLSSLTREDLTDLSSPIRETLEKTPYSSRDGNPVSVKSMLESLLLPFPPQPLDFCLCCAALAAAAGEDSPYLYWIPSDLSLAARDALKGLSRLVALGDERALLEGLMKELFPGLKRVIKEGCVDPDGLEVVSASAKVPVEHAIIAAHQFRWFLTQVSYPHIGKLCSLVIPCALTALDHWSPEVKGQGMVSMIYLAKNVNSAELGWYEDPILDACLQNIASGDELWHHVVEMSVISLTSILQRNPHNPWYEKILVEMLSHLERQPMNKDRRIAWLQLIEPVLEALGLVLLVHFRRIFPLIFLWLHADDDKTVTLVLEQIYMIVKLTWMRKSPHFSRLIDELALVYKEAAMRKDREVIRSRTVEILVLLKKCKGIQFETTWDKHKDDPNLGNLLSSLNETQAA